MAEFISGGEIPKAFVGCWLAMIVSMTFWLLCTMIALLGCWSYRLVINVGAVNPNSGWNDRLNAIFQNDLYLNDV